jgi:tetratricopeptide (TPR) repeat protein
MLKKTQILNVLLVTLLLGGPLLSFAQGGDKGATVLRTAATKKGTTYALIIGISDYANPKMSLNAADKDAQLLSAFLLHSKRVDEKNLNLLLNKEATSAAVNKAVAAFANIKFVAGDEAIIYFSGHGDIQKEKVKYKGYLLCHDVNVERVYAGAAGTLSFERLNKVIDAIAQQKVMVNLVLDACHSGYTVNEEGAKLLSESALISFSNTIRFLSCGPEQRSYEDSTLGQGYFTYYLVKGLSGEADNGPTDNKINVDELNRFVKDKVKLVSRQKQSPSIKAADDEKIVALINDDAKNFALENYKTNPAFIAFAKGRGLARGLLAAHSDNTNTTDAAASATMLSLLQQQQFDSAIALYLQHQQNNTVSTATLFDWKYAIISLLEIDPQQAVKTILAGKNNLPTAAYFKAAADKSHQLLAILDTADYGYKVYILYSLYLEAYSYLRGKNFKQYTKAKALLEKAIGIEPNAAYVLHALGLVAEYQHQFDVAEQYYKQAIQLIPTWTYPRSSLGNCLKEQGKYAQAIKVFKEVIVMAPDFSWPYNNLANVYLDLKNYAAAERLYQMSIRKDSVDVSIETSNLGVVFEERKNLKQAAIYYEQAIKKDSTNVQALYNLSGVYEKTKAEAAENILLQAIAIEPFFAKGFTELADYYSKGGSSNDWKKADSLYQQAAINNPYYPWAYAGRAWVLMKLNDTTNALPLFKQGIDMNKNNAAAVGYYARYFQNTDQHRLAIEWFNKAIAINPYYLWPYECLSDIYTEINQPDSAELMLKKAIPNFSQSPEVYNMLGDLYYANGKYKAALEQYRKAVYTDNNFAAAYGNLAYAALENNSFEEAIKLILKANENNPVDFKLSDFVVTALDKADALVQQNKIIEAIADLVELKRLTPNNHQLQYRLARLYYLNDKSSEAIAELLPLVQNTALSNSYLNQYYQSLGWAYIDAGKVTEAEAIFKQGLMYSGNPSQLGLAICALAKKDNTTAAQLKAKEDKAYPNWKDASKWNNRYSKATQFLLQQLINVP